MTASPSAKMQASRSPGGRRRLLLICGVLAPLLIVHFNVPPRGGLWLGIFLDSLHVPVFAIVAACVFALAAEFGVRRTAWRAAITLAVAALLGAASEAAQIFTPRDASLHDLGSDLLGALGIVLIAVAISARHRHWRLRSLSVLMGIAVFVVALAPLIQVSLAYLERNAQLPQLVSFDSKFSQFFMRSQNSDLSFTTSAQTGAPVARTVLGNGSWPGLIFSDIWPDWRDYEQVVLDIAVTDGEPLSLNFRVHDLQHSRGEQPFSDRFNMTLDLAPGAHSVRIPLDDIAAAPRGRAMDMSRIHGMVIFAARGNAGRTFELAGIHLE